VKLGLACDGGPPPSQVLDLLERAGLQAGALRGVPGPALLDADDATWLLAPGADVLEACARGALDAGIAGKDLLLELAPQLHELLDLRLCRDVLVYATPEPAVGVLRRARTRVATRYPQVTRRHFAATGRQVELVAFDAALLAPGLGIADGVVELRSRLTLDDGSTGAGAAVGLRVREDIAACSARLVAGRAARALGGGRLAELLERLRASVEEI
jgi:ATP phosphoribosyltransferase